jgi:AraC-like DNA-binding protein
MARITKRNNNLTNLERRIEAAKASERETQEQFRKEIEVANEELRLSIHKNDKYQDTLSKVLDGTAELSDLLDISQADIDFKQCHRKIKMIQLIYAGGTQVGACTVVAGNMYTIKINERSAEAFKKSLKMLTEKESHTPYKSVWVEGFNKHTYKFSNGKFYVYYVVTNAEIEELAKRIKAMDYNSVSLEELQALQNDLPPFVRAWQESSIDVSKDKSKVFNIPFSKFFRKVNVKSDFYGKQLDNITLNFDVVKQLHMAGRTNDITFKVTLPQSSEVYDDMLGELNEEIAKAVEKYFNGDLAELYKMSSRTFYKQFSDACLAYPKLAWYIQQVYTLCAQAYQEDVRMTKEQYELLRDAIYSYAEDMGMTDTTKVVEVAISVAMRYIKEAEDKEGNKYIDLGTANEDNFKPSKVINIFPNEYVALRTGKKETKELTLIYVDKDTRIEEGTAIGFKDGVSTSFEYIVEVEELFTGVAYNKGGKLVYDVEPYGYNHISTVITTDTFAAEATPRDQKKDSGEFATEFLETNETVAITGKNKNVLISADGKTLVARVIASPVLVAKKAYKVSDYISFQPNEGKDKVFFILLDKLNK